MEINKIYQGDCMEQMPKISDGYVNLTLTDIPYNSVNKTSGGREKYCGQLRTIDKGNADILTFNLTKFLDEIYRITT